MLKKLSPTSINKIWDEEDSRRKELKYISSIHFYIMTTKLNIEKLLGSSIFDHMKMLANLENGYILTEYLSALHIDTSKKKHPQYPYTADEYVDIGHQYAIQRVNKRFLLPEVSASFAHKVDRVRSLLIYLRLGQMEILGFDNTSDFDTEMKKAGFDEHMIRLIKSSNKNNDEK